MARTVRGAYAKSADTRTAIAKAALAIVREKGHSALTTAEVSQRAAVSEATRFYHFPTRDHVLVAAMRFADDEAAAHFATEAGLVDDNLAFIPQLLARSGRQDDKVLRLFTALQAEAPNPAHPAHEYFTEHYSRATTSLAGALRRRQADGLAHPDLDPDTVARQLLGVWGGLQTQWLVNPNFDLAGEVEQAFRRLTGQIAMEAKQAIDDLMAKI